MKVKFIQRLISKIKEKRKAKGINKVIRQYRFIHIMFNDKFGKPFVDFLNRNFDTKEHLVLCKRTCDEFPFPQGENVIEIKMFRYLNFSKSEKVFFHSLFDHESIKYLYKHQDILKEKAYWQIWGGDLYNAPRDKKNDFVRENFRGYITDVDGDRAVLEKRYTTRKNKKFYHATYTFPVTLNMIDEAKTSLKKRNATIIQINNSCDDSTLEMLDTLSRFEDKNIIIKTILSYGKLEFKQQIIDKGNAIFGGKFEFIDTLLSPQDYAKYVSENDVLVLNQNRQQGLGNSFLALAFGAKLYIRSEISTYDYLISNGNKVFDSTQIAQIGFAEFIAIDKETKQSNIQNSLKFFSDEYAKNLFEKVFYDSLEYWQNRAKKHGKHSVYNMAHPRNELESVDKYQEQIYSNVLKKHLDDTGGGQKLVALDFGCGPGRFEPMLSNIAHKVYATDPISTLIDLAPKIDNVEYLLLGENEKIALPNDSVDLVFVSLALGGIVDEAQLKIAIDELKRVAKQNALFFIVENTARQDNQRHWHYRSAGDYINLFKPIRLKLEKTYEDINEEISVMVGR